MSISDKNMGAMLSLTLEIEGLLLLLQRRGDLVHPEVATLLNQKIAELSRYAGSVVTVAADDAASASSAVSVDTDPSVPAAHDTPLSPDAEAIARSAEFEEIEHADMPAPSQPTPVCPASPSESAPHQPVVAHEPSAPKVVADTMPKFTLNDRFRFRNSLFNGDEKEFADTLTVISGMSSAREVEEYVADDLCLDPADSDVADFLAIVTARFA